MHFFFLPSLLRYNYRAGDKNVTFDFGISATDIRCNVKAGKRQLKYNIEQIKTGARTDIRRRFDFGGLYERVFFYKGVTEKDEYVRLVRKFNINVVGYFGNTAGYDGFKGQDIAVMGTPHVTNMNTC
ncbi:hypothetical protein GCM10010918_31850 [Paenibacillus radicis (ex Gao et al. 2016)]|uniref:Uncharacterized protein n=1 Tax=Paenibacillus radicis (ex Gao et al. 2016) TaxID=1737354 RepID=A0A917M2C1_9BACL|nr:hypothetical protein GCM10010918_31850 [Paenibacillus radicis (ex Gao et al. 2016)]